MGRQGHGEGGVVHGSTGRHTPQPTDQVVLREAPQRRQAQEGGFGGLHAQVAHHPQRDAKEPYPLELSPDSSPLTLETVASSSIIVSNLSPIGKDVVLHA